jgi:toxin ParE1/3/4
MSLHKPLPLKLSPRARQDLIDILRYTGETWGQSQLLVYRDKMNDALTAIAQNPKLGHDRLDLPSSHLAFLVGSHIIIYRIIGDSIGIVRVLHQRMSVAKNI